MGPDSYEIGTTALGRHEWDAAVEAFTGVLEQHKDDPAALLQRGKAYYCRGDFWEAHQDFKRALHLSPNLPGAKGCFRHAQLAVESERSQAHQPVWFGLGDDCFEPLDEAWRKPEVEEGRVGLLFGLVAVLVLAAGAWALLNL